ncbi:MAG: radical SAM superfamily enzyme YgiQ (UPF0313 family) [Myxococcota bacterium]
MSDIVLATLNARYIHASLGLRYLFANLGTLQDRTIMIERLANESADELVELFLSHEPRVIGLGVYIWNVEKTLEVVRLLRALRPELIIVLGGPEVSHEVDEQEITALADYVVTGEGEAVFAPLCSALLEGNPPVERVIAGGLPDLSTLELPYAYYTEQDVAHRHIYVEASRGCPFRCEFCLSSLDKAVRAFPMEALMASLDDLYARGARNFRFVDRTFNLDIATATRLLNFFGERCRPDSDAEPLFVHFEMVPDRFPEELREVVKQYPAGTLQFEIGVQTLAPEVSRRISRPLKVERVDTNIRWLMENTEVHLHTDLIVGLPGEDLASFGRGFNHLVALKPHEIQVGILKRLRGTPIRRHTEGHRMVYSPRPPYEIMQTDVIQFAELQRLKRFAKVWEMTANRGVFPTALPLLLAIEQTPFHSVLAFADWLFARDGAVHSIALLRLAEATLAWLLEKGADETSARDAVVEDYSEGGRRRPSGNLTGKKGASRVRRSNRASRQLRHIDG